MTNSTEPIKASWTNARSAKEKTAVRRSLTALLDELAPERVLTRIKELQGPVEQYRTPGGCVLQAATAAVSVTWFDPGPNDTSLGQLRIIVWNGRVARRGTTNSGKGATTVAEVELHPIEKPADDKVWRSSEGEEFTSAGLASHCLHLLETQVVANRGSEDTE